MAVASVPNTYQGYRIAEASQPTGFQHPIPNIHALLIGIDTYANVTNLSGASKDADSVGHFLRVDLSVPASQITNLRNEQATRSGILTAFEELRRNPNIVPFDPIVIYYAGHGVEVDTPSTDLGSHEDKTQCLVPWDAGKQDAEGNLIPPIPDYTIAALLYAIAAEKGNNITVIFDCCHSASSTRGIQHISYRGAQPESNPNLSKWKIDKPFPVSTHRARRLEPEDLPALTRDVDKGILQEYARIYPNFAITSIDSHRMTPIQVQSGFRRFGRSHVFLAACGHAEIAYESTTSNSGYFTTALLQRLRSSRIHKLTYKACFEDFPRFQNPVCEGDDTGRIFFSTTVVKGHSALVPIEQSNGQYFIKAGIAQGVIPGSVYGIYEDDVFGETPEPGHEIPLEQTSALCGTFIANPCTEKKLYPCRSWCDLLEGANIPSHPRAKLLKRGDSHKFEVFISDALKKKLIGASIPEANQGIIQVDSPDKCKVVLDVDEKSEQMTVELHDFSGKLLHRCNADSARVQSILFSMAQWDWHLYREPTTNAPSKKERAQLHIYRLGQAEPTPIPLENGLATLAVSPGGNYGLKVKSLFNRRLYVYLFYFSTMSQSIRSLFLSVYGSGHVDAPLDANGELTIGYGNDDMISGPLSFRTTPDLGYFKLFLTTLPADFDSMTQPSPFIDPDKVQATAFGNGDEYSDGVEIGRPGLVTYKKTAHRALPIGPCTYLDDPDRLADAKATSFDTDGGGKPAFNSITNSIQGNKALFSSSAGMGSSPRMMASSEVSERLDKQDIWDVVTLKVVLRSAEC